MYSESSRTRSPAPVETLPESSLEGPARSRVRSSSCLTEMSRRTYCPYYPLLRTCRRIHLTERACPSLGLGVCISTSWTSAKPRMAHTRARAPASDAIDPNWERARAFECYHFPLEYNRAIGPRADCNRCARAGLSCAIASLVFECALAKGCWGRDACRAMGRERLYSSRQYHGTRGTNDAYRMMSIEYIGISTEAIQDAGLQE